MIVQKDLSEGKAKDENQTVIKARSGAFLHCRVRKRVKCEAMG